MKDQQSAIDNTLEQQALSERNAKHYKEAIELYKQLWENSDDKKWQQQLAYCYLQRALSFGNRGMLREAFVLWDNYIQYATPPYQAYEHFICWQIQAQDSNNIQSALKQLTAEQIDTQYPELAALLGCLILTGHSELQHYLPADSIFIAHLKLAQTALQAYLDNNALQLTEVLKQIPYRSAFKDFRLLINSALNFPQSMEQALPKIPANSPYSQAMSLLHTCTLDGAKLVKQLTQCGYAQTKIVTEIKALNYQQQQLIDFLIQQPLSDQIKFDLLIQYQSLLADGEAESVCKNLLISYPEGYKLFNKHFRALNSFETNRLKALATEQKDNNADAEQYWRQCIEALQNESTDNKLKIALILRHMAERQADSDLCNDLLIESLDYDAEDLTSYLKILHFLGQYEVDNAEYKQWLQKAIDIFPQEIELLALAIKTATEQKDYRQSSQYAVQILVIDPLNSLAKGLLFSSYLEQARQLIQAKEYHLVEQQIQQAENLKLGQKYRAQAQLFLGLFYLATEDKNQALGLISESLSKLHEDPVNAYLHAAMEALLTELPVTSVLQALDPVQESILSAQQLTHVIQQLNHYGNDFDQQLLLLKAIEKIKASLKISLSQQHYDEALLLELSQTLDNINAFELLQHCAELSVERWNAPIWQYYVIYAEQKGAADKCSPAQINRLEDIREQAIQVKDDRVKLLIDTFVEQYYQAHSDSSTGIIGNLFNLNEAIEDDDYLDPSDELFKHIPEDELLKITHKSDDLMMETTPEQLVEGLTGDGNNNEYILLAMMQDPELFSALMVLKAANVLQIEINLAVNDVLGFFDVAKTS